jgi:hypothetical protein
MYIIPSKTSDSAETEALIARSGAELLEPKSLYEFVRLSNYDSIQFMRVDDLMMTKIMRNLGDIVPEGQVPQVLMNVPGHAQTSRWASEAVALAPIDWKQVEPTLLKSGIVSGDAATATTRSVASRKGTDLGNLDATEENKLDDKFSDFSLKEE